MTDEKLMKKLQELSGWSNKFMQRKVRYWGNDAVLKEITQLKKRAERDFVEYRSMGSGSDA